MGLTKEYSRYEAAGKLNIITSAECNVVFLTLKGQIGRFVAVAGCEDIIIWDLRLGEKALVLAGDKHQVSYLLATPNINHLAAGYADGSVKLFDLTTGDELTCFLGHHEAISCLASNKEGHFLTSGSKDTHIIVWDVVAEVGLHRLIGHKNAVTQVRFVPGPSNVLVSCSKDSFVKLWDLDTAHCYQTLVGNTSEVWGLTIALDRFLVTGSKGSELQVWELSPRADDDLAEKDSAEKDPTETTWGPLQCKLMGKLLRSTTGRILSLTADPTGSIVAFHGSRNMVELFRFRPKQEVAERLKKRRRKQRKRGEEVPSEEADQVCLVDLVERLPLIKPSSKVKSCDLVSGRGSELRVVVTLASNSVELYSLHIADKDSEQRCLSRIFSHGHRSEVRAVAFSSDNLAIVSGSSDSVKVWNRPSLACLRSVDTGYVLSICVVPGDRHLLLGMKDGRLLIVDMVAGDITEEIAAHKELWSLCLTPDKRGVVSGGGDSTVKFWQFDLMEDKTEPGKARVFSVLHTRTLKLEESVLAVKVSPNNQLLAVALLDSSVQVFFVDTLKHFLKLFGHKLPVLCMDVSHDSRLIVTGGADRNVKIWGLDFGDCRRSLFAHDDCVLGLQFVPRTHLFFSCGKDGCVKQWDSDSFQKITTLKAHHGEAWALAVSPDGQYVISSGSDRVLRLWQRSEEILVLQDEEEEERAEQDEAQLVSGDATNVPGLMGLNLPSRKTVGSEKAADQLMESLEVGREYSAVLAQHAAVSKAASKPLPTPQRPPLMVAYGVSSAEALFLDTLDRIRIGDLEEALILLPFTQVCEILQLLPAMMEAGHRSEQLCNVLVFLLHTHHGPIINNLELIPVINKLQGLAFSCLTSERDRVGYNLHALGFLQREISPSLDTSETFQDHSDKSRKSKKGRMLKRAILTL